MRRVMFGPGLVSAVLLGLCGAGASLAACSSSSSGGSSGTDGGTSGVDSSTTDGGGSAEAAACTNTSALQIHFAPMYSAFVTDSTTHTFQVPAIFTGGTGKATWSASDPTAVSFQDDLTTGGTLMTIKSATPSVTITAQVGTDCGSTTLNVTPATEADWQAGNARYNNNVPIIQGCIDGKIYPLIVEAGIPIAPPMDSGCPDAGPSCTSCHGSAPTGGFFKGVQHTPEQTAGFSDQDLVNIFVNGTVADGGPYDPHYLPYEYWTLFHTWSDIATPEAQKGMVVYLRSLTPVVEEGGLNFGGLQDAGILGD